ncbi:MAG TPA: YceI family protein [Cyclobacteriaceae bacterium]|nr:YceI family protein [Cyclobacteriaceae bacterium]
MKKLNAVLLALLISGSVFAQTKWNLDKAHSNLTFAITHMTVAETTGTFNEYEVNVTSPAEDFNGADVSFTAKTASINTGNTNRDKDLVGPNYFEAEKYPTIAFAGKLTKDGGKYKLKGKLTMKDVTKDVEFDVTYRGTVKTEKFTKAGFKLVGQIDRFDYNLKSDSKVAEGGGLVLGREVNFTANIELNLAK